MTAAGPTPKEERGRSASLDGLRGIAILMVLFVHFLGDAIPRGRAQWLVVKLSNYGVWGVDLFFVLSGFLITGILFDDRASESYFRRFYVRRTLRIFPLYYGVLALLFVVLPLVRPSAVPEGLKEARELQPWLWGYGTNVLVSLQKTWGIPYVSHFWSLAVEEHFYLVWPFIVRRFEAPALLRIAFGMSIGALLLRCVLSFAGAGDVALTALTPCRLDALGAGAFLAVAMRQRGNGSDFFTSVTRPDNLRWAAKWTPWTMTAMVGMLSAANAALPAARDIVLPLRGTFVALTACAWMLRAVLAGHSATISRVLGSRPLGVLGKYSYGLYVFHGIIAYAILDLSVPETVSGAIAQHFGTPARVTSWLSLLCCAGGGALVSLVISVLSYELYEKHFLRLKDRLAPSASVGPRRAALAVGAGIACILLLACSAAAIHTPATTSDAASLPPTTDSPAPEPRAAVPIAPSPLLSHHKRVEARSASRYTDPRAALDGNADTSWDAGHPTKENPAWIAVDVGKGPKRVLFFWSARGSFDYEETDFGSPGSYRIEVSSDSTNGDDGQWTPVATVATVTTHSREHSFDFTDRRWVRMVVMSAPEKSPNGVQIDEISVHDVSNTASDVWFFAGDSITAHAFGRLPSASSFASMIHSQHSTFDPVVIGGGIGGTKAADGEHRIDDWLAQAPDAHFFGIAYGTNDAAGNNPDTSRFEASLRAIVQRVQEAGRVPILATIPFSNDKNHETIPRFNLVVELIRAEASLPKGPDLYSWFHSHPDELADGVHPNDRGKASINRLWAEAARPFYLSR